MPLPSRSSNQGGNEDQRAYSLEIGPHSIEINEQTTTNLHGTTVWPAATALVNFFASQVAKKKPTPLATHPAIGSAEDTACHQPLRGKRVLELGAGTGLLSIYLGLLGATVTATDQDEPAILTNLQANIDRNRPSGGTHYDVKVVPHNWGTELDSRLQTLADRECDYVIAADCVYTLEPLPLLLQSLARLATARTTVLIAMERRDPLVSDRFVALARSNFGFTLSKIPRSRFRGAVVDSDSMEVFKMGVKRNSNGEARVLPVATA